MDGPQSSLDQKYYRQWSPAHQGATEWRVFLPTFDDLNASDPAKSGLSVDNASLISAKDAYDKRIKKAGDGKTKGSKTIFQKTLELTEVSLICTPDTLPDQVSHCLVQGWLPLPPGFKKTHYPKKFADNDLKTHRLHDFSMLEHCSE